MAKKIKIFGRKIEWYDVKTKFKQLTRKLLYTSLFQYFLSSIIFTYIWLIYFTSKKEFINSEIFLNEIKNDRSVIIAFWHNRLMMAPLVPVFVKNNVNKKHNFITLASKHGDGRFVGIVMQFFGFRNIYGSSNDGRKTNRGIDISSLREIIRGLKNGKSFGITPDGPRGPNQKINSEIINIAKIAQKSIAPVSYSASNFIQFNSWDKFKLPLPFSKINFYFGDLIKVEKNISDEDEKKLRLELEERMNFVQTQSEKF